MLIALRSTFIGLVGSLFAITITFSLLKPTGHASWTLWIVVVIGTLSLAYITRLRRRPLDSRSLETLATSYRIRWLIGVGLAEAVALWGFVGTFFGGNYPTYFVGVGFSLVGLLMMAPTRGDIERRQEQITAAGSPLSLLKAVTSIPTGRRP